MKRFAIYIFALVLVSATCRASAGEELVLIVSARTNPQALDSIQVRRLFLGLTVTQQGLTLRPVRNAADAKIKELFLQNIVSMSDNTCDRYTLRMSLSRGQTPPAVYNTHSQLIDAVAADDHCVGYAWAHDVADDPRVRILRVLWHD